MIYNVYDERLRSKMERILKVYADKVFIKVGEATDFQYMETPQYLRVPPKEGLAPIAPGQKWGFELGNMWLVGKITVPAEAAGKKLVAVPKADAVEILTFKNGKPDGIINSKNKDVVGGNHPVQLLTTNAVPGETFDVAYDCYAGHYCPGTQPYDSYGQDGITYSKSQFEHIYNGTDICVVDEEIWKFIWDLTIVNQLAGTLEDGNFLKGKAQNALEEAFKYLVAYPADRSEEEFRNGIRVAEELFAPVLEKGEPDGLRGKMGIIGHSHMDTAWLWPVAETVRKCARTYSNALKLMEIDPNYKFIQSSALHLDWMRRYYPTIFEDIKKRVSEGRYEPNGGVWVECDCNITSGEFMARQFLHGQQFTRKYMNYTSDSFWLPDTFGYSASIPQIMQESGVKYFYTTKISWADLNTFPVDTFKWRGLDGTGVITHFNVIHTFPDVNSACRLVKDIKHKSVHDSRFLSFGFGDGGGGPTPGMLETANRIIGLKGIPEVKYMTASEFMQDVEKNAVNLPEYRGELYLEYHRGTLTMMHDVKRNNRKAEFAFRDMEALGVIAGDSKNSKSDEWLETILLNQFHDILPGTCIHSVYEKVYQEMTDVIAKLKNQTKEYIGQISSKDNDTVSVYNTLSFDRNDVLVLDTPVSDGIGQKITTLDGNEAYAVKGITVPAFGAVNLKKASSVKATKDRPFVYEGNVLETPFYTVTFDETGRIAFLFDKEACREVRNPNGNPLNTFLIAENLPLSYDNWDIDYDNEFKYKEDTQLVNREIANDGAVMFTIRSEYKLGDRSSVKQDMIFYADDRRIDFPTVIDWKEKHTIFKVEFNVDILTNVMKNEIQFGHAERPVTRNNSLEVAKFEVCNHKWTDLSENGFGVAILNDCKYGISCYDGDLRLTLHRGGTRPDYTGDEGVHSVTYSLLPHNGRFNAETVIRPSYELNIPTLINEGKTDRTASFITVSSSNIFVEALKPAEDIDNAFVARMYEAERTGTMCEISVPADVKHVYSTNILEEVKEELAIENGFVKDYFKPFQIKTYLFVK